MKKSILQFGLSCVAMVFALASQAQVTTVVVSDSIATNTHWTCDKQYLLMGYVYVVDGTTLTIDSGVVIRGDKNTKGTLIIERGAKLYANGTLNHPIIFTSNQALNNRNYGDWGGVVLCGKSPCNWSTGQGQVEGGPRSHYGGTDPHDNSGAMHYVRIEFAGVALSPNNEINGLTFCSVGDQTQIDHIMVAYSGDDSYEFFGGTVNCKYMVSLCAWDDDFDTDNGYAGNVQYGVCLRDPFAADYSGSKGFESDSYQNGTYSGLTDTLHLTHPVFDNMTLIGPMVSATSTAYDPEFVAGVHIRRGSSLSCFNSVIAGWPCGILLDESSASFGSTTANIRDSSLQFRSVIIAGIPTTNSPGRKELMYVIDGARSLTPTTTWADTTTGNPFGYYNGPFSWFEHPGYKNKIYPAVQANVHLTNPFNLTNPSFVPLTVSPLIYNSTALPAYVLTHYGNNDPFGNGGKYPYNGTLPINLDTSNFFNHYNAPDFKPTTSSYKLGSFFDVANHAGAFGFTGTASDDWTRVWANWDPENADYSNAVCQINTGINPLDAGTVMFAAYPNPASNKVVFTFSTENGGPVTIEIYDLTGRIVKTINNIPDSNGFSSLQVDVTSLNSGLYLAKLITGQHSRSIKLNISK